MAAVPVSATDPNGVRAIVCASALSTAGVLPMFLTGGLVVFIRADIPVTAAQLGLLVSTFFLASAVSSLPGGQLAERRGPRAAVNASAACSGLCLLGIGQLSTELSHLTAWMVLGGIGNGLGQPTSNLILARGVPQRHKGLAFGIKQAAIPGATMVTGGAVGVVAGAVGWRIAASMWALLALAVVVSVPTDLRRQPRRAAGPQLRGDDAGVRPLLVLAVAAGFGSAVGTSLASFFVEAAVVGGIPAATAGLLLTVSSLAGIGVRLLIGWVADRMVTGHLRLVLQLSVVGSLGFVGLALAEGSTMVLLASLVAFTAGWGWPGLFNFAVVRWNATAPAIATSITQSGVFVGGVIGPATFGFVSERASFAHAWLGAALMSLLSAVAVQAGRRALQRDRRRREAPTASPDGSVT